MKKLILFILLFPSLIFAAEGGSPNTRFEEFDGSPSGRPRTIYISNNTLTDNGDGSFDLSCVSSLSGDNTYLKLDQSAPQTVTGGAPIFGEGLTLTTGKHLLIGTTQWDSSDEIDGTKIKDADYGDITVSAGGVWTMDAALTTDINIQNVDPTLTLTSTDDSNYMARLRRVALNRELSLYNQVNVVAGTPYAFLFDGTDDYVTAGTTSALDFYNSDYSYSFWVYYHGVGEDGNGGTIIGRYSGGAGFLIYYKSVGADSGFMIQEDADTWTQVSSLTADVWTHIVVTKSGNTRTLYKNSVSAGTDDHGAYTQNLTAEFEIGIYGETNQGLNGAVDEVGVWNRALTQAEINTLYNGGSGVYGDILRSPYNTGFVAGWHADEGTGTVANCYGGSYTGTLTNNATWVTPGPVVNSGVTAALVFKSQDGTAAGEEGINTFGDGQGRTVIDGKTIRFNINEVEKVKIDASGDLTQSAVTPKYVFKNTGDNTAMCFHSNVNGANDPWGVFQLWPGTDTGTGFNVSGNPIWWVDSSHNIYFPAGVFGASGAYVPYTGATTNVNLGTYNLTTTGTLGAGAITGTSFIIGVNTLNTTEWAYLDGQDQTVKTTSTPYFGRLGINAAASNGEFDITTNAIGETQSDANGIYLVNTTAAIGGLQQYSPPIVLRGYGYGTGAELSKSCDWRAFVCPVQSGGVPYSFLKFQSSVNGAAYATAVSYGYQGSNGYSLAVGAETPSYNLDVWTLATGGSTINRDIIGITNPNNAASMTDTRSSILFNQYYYDVTTPAISTAARITVGTEGNWTSASSTKDAYIAFLPALNGTPTERVRIDSAGHITLEGVTSTGATGTGKFVFDTSPVFTTPNIGSATGSISGNAATVTTNANLTGVITSVGNATSIASQTGTGTKFVVDTSPVLVTPNLGTPSAGSLGSCTNYDAGNLAGTTLKSTVVTSSLTSVGTLTGFTCSATTPLFSGATTSLGFQNDASQTIRSVGNGLEIDYYSRGNVMLGWNTNSINCAGTNIVGMTGTGFNPVGAGSISSGTSSNYWNDVSYKTITDRGCLGSFDDGVELQDGTIVSDVEAIKAIKVHPTKKTIYGTPMLDYRTFPKVSYKPATDRGRLLPRDKDDEPYLDKEYKTEKVGDEHIERSIDVHKPASDGIEMTSMFSIFIGAFKELDARVATLEKKVKILEKENAVLKGKIK